MLLNTQLGIVTAVPIQALLKRFALIYLPIVIIFSISLLSYASLDKQRRVEKIGERERNRIEIAKDTVTQDFSAISTDLRIVAKLPYLSSGNPRYREEMIKFFRTLAQESQLYDKVRYIDANGQEDIRINYHDGEPDMVPREQLQNKSNRYFVNDTFKLNQGEVFVSPLDLNIEHDRLEIPYKPTIRFGSPLFDNVGQKKGVILFNYFGEKLLQRFRKVMQGDDLHSGMLLNSDGYWLSGAKREDEWGFMLGKNERTFGHDFAEEWRTISAAEQGTLLTGNGLFAYTTVYPLLPGQHSSTGSDLVNAPSAKELTGHEYNWKIVSFVPHDDISGAAFYNQIGNRILLVCVYLLFALSAWMVALATLNSKKAKANLMASENRYRQIIQTSMDGCWVVDTKGRILEVNDAYCQLIGYTREELLNMRIPELEAQLSPEEVAQRIQEIMAKGYGRFETRHQRKDGQVLDIEISTVYQPDKEGGYFCAFLRDITEHKQTESKISFLAYHDHLTELPNRELFYDRLSHAISQARRKHERLALLFLDLDGFKAVNDSYGHEAGDMVLKMVAIRLQTCVRGVRLRAWAATSSPSS